MKIKKYLILILLIFTIACEKKEISIINDLTKKLQETKGDVDNATLILEKFLDENRIKMKEAVNDLNSMETNDDESVVEKDKRLLEFNNIYYDKKGLDDLIKYKYHFENDEKFMVLFNKFKKNMGGFFSNHNF